MLYSGMGSIHFCSLGKSVLKTFFVQLANEKKLPTSVKTKQTLPVD